MQVDLAFNADHAPMHALEQHLARFPHIGDPLRRRFAAMHSAMDDNIGKVLTALRRHGLEERTLLAAAGIDVKSEWKLDGVNLLPYLTGKNTKPPHEALYWRFGAQMAVRMGDWKLVKAPGAGADGPPARGARATTDGAHLYNLATDIGEESNLATTQPERAKQLAEAPHSSPEMCRRLERKPQRELDIARRRGARDCAEVGVCHVGRDVQEIRLVEEVEKVCLELQPPPLGHREPLA
jgi:arylsulfatase A-like enzyme